MQIQDTNVSTLLLLAPLVIALAACNTVEETVSGMTGSQLSLVGGAGPAVFDSSTDDSPSFSGSVDESDTALNLGVAYRFHPNVSGELSYTDFGELSFDGLYMGTPSVGTVSATAIEATGVYHHPLNDRWELLGQAGIVFWDAEEEELFGGVPDPDSKTGTSTKIGIGVQANVAKQVAVRLTLDRYLDIWDDSVDVGLIRIVYSF